MTEHIISALVTGAAFFIGGKLLSGVTIRSYVQAILIAIVVAVLDVTLGTVLKIVTLGILSLGIFTWLLNAILILVKKKSHTLVQLYLSLLFFRFLSQS